MAKVLVVDLACLGWDDDRAAQYIPYDRPCHLPGKIIRVGHGVYTAMTSMGATRVTVGGAVLIRAAVDRAALPRLGDWLVIRRWPDRRLTIEAILPRPVASLRDRGVVVRSDRGTCHTPSLQCPDDFCEVLAS